MEHHYPVKFLLGVGHFMLKGHFMFKYISMHIELNLRKTSESLTCNHKVTVSIPLRDSDVLPQINLICMHLKL